MVTLDCNTPGSSELVANTLEDLADIIEDVVEIESETDENHEEDDDVEEQEWNVGNEKNAAETTFNNPSQIDVDKVVEDALNLTVDEVVNETAQNAISERMDVIDSEELKCDLCIFKTTDKIRFQRHKFENHSVKGKYKCIQCLEEFDKRKHFNHHNYKGCNSPED